MGNSGIRWEKRDEMDVGVDGDFWGGKLWLSGELLLKNRDGILLKLGIGDLVGVCGGMENGGKVGNIGFELGLGDRNEVNRFRY